MALPSRAISDWGSVCWFDWAMSLTISAAIDSARSKSPNWAYSSEIANQQKRVKKMRARKVPVVARHGLDEVSLVRETSWRGIVDGMTGGYIDAAQMPSGMPLWITLGGAADRSVPIVSALTMTRNGNAITLDKRFEERGVQTLADFKAMLRESPDKPHRMGVVHPSSMHNLLLRYWLASAGIDPDRDLQLKMIPPAQMVVDLKAGTIDGFCVGDPWNLRAATEGSGYTIATDLDIWNGHPGKVLGVRDDWANAYPNTHIALVKALLEACFYCADPNNENEIRQILARREYVGTNMNYIQLSSPHVTGGGALPSSKFSHHQFYGEGVNRPSRTEHLWHMAQMARWGDVPFPRNWVEVLEKTCRVGIFSTAARELGLSNITYSRGAIKLFDGTTFNAEDPLDYLNHLEIKRDFTMAEIALEPSRSVA
jgi:bicarbonate transport system ATP-binding protein